MIDDTDFGRENAATKRNTNPWGLPLARPRCLLILHIPKQRSLFHQPSSKGRAYTTTSSATNKHCSFYIVIDAQTMVERAVERLECVADGSGIWRYPRQEIMTLLS
jgi:hypothetical protein